MDLYGSGQTTNSHGGNPVCCAAALASIEVLLKERLVENAALVGEVLHRGLNELQQRHADVLGAVHGRGLVAGVHVTKPHSMEPDRDLAQDIIERCVEKGLLMFSPVGPATIKVCPPLCITPEAVTEGVAVLGEAVHEILKR
jgi:4-aminobutyrate aminotransferase-like enzyme